MITVTLFIQSDCPQCDQAIADLGSLQDSIPHRLVIVDVDKDPALKQAYNSSTPVVEVGPYRLVSPFTRQDLMVALGAARDRRDHLESVGDKGYQARLERGHVVTTSDRVSAWLAHHYILLFNVLAFLYVGLPFLAPILMEIGATGPAQVIYKIYSPLCHQLAYRSWFLFGEQPAYPQVIAHVPGLITFGQATGINESDYAAARAFIGNAALGFKVAICERDIAIYASILLFGLIFAATGNRLKPLPWYVWILIGILPIAVDGTWQLVSELGLPSLSWLPVHESTPFLRTLTGGLFGFTTAWFGYPYIEENMIEVRRILAHKRAVIAQA